MGRSTGQRWIKAALILGKNPKEKVLCPGWQKDYLEVFDVILDKDTTRLERQMYCKSCGAYNALLMRERYDD